VIVEGGRLAGAGAIRAALAADARLFLRQLEYLTALAASGTSAARWRPVTSPSRRSRPRRTQVPLAATRRFVIGTPIYALSIATALVSAPACLAVNALLALYYALPSGGAMAHVDG
jgi:hypothetical protein